MKHTGHTLNEILTISPILREIVHKVEQLAKLNTLVLNKLETQLSQNCRVANLRAGILSLTTPSPIWGHKLRFASSELLATLRKEPEYCALKSITIQVRPNEIPPVDRSGSGVEPPRASSVGALCLEKTAETLPASPLRVSVLRLANRLSKKKTVTR